MKIRFGFTIVIRRDDDDEPLTVDRVGTHHDIPAATYDTGFQPPLEEKR